MYKKEKVTKKVSLKKKAKKREIQIYLIKRKLI